MHWELNGKWIIYCTKHFLLRITFWKNIRPGLPFLFKRYATASSKNQRIRTYHITLTNRSFGGHRASYNVVWPCYAGWNVSALEPVFLSETAECDLLIYIFCPIGYVRYRNCLRTRRWTDIQRTITYLQYLWYRSMRKDLWRIILCFIFVNQTIHSLDWLQFSESFVSAFLSIVFEASFRTEKTRL